MSFGYKENGQGEIIPTDFHLYAGSSQRFKNRVLNVQGRNVLKFSSVYGANASGKTNLIRAIECGKSIITSSMEQANLRNQYCRNSKKNKEMPTFFEYEFTIGEKCYAYGFTVNLSRQEVLSEWLYELRGEKEISIFERAVQSDAYYFDEERFSEKENIQQFHFFLKDANRVKTSLLLYELHRRNILHCDFEEFNEIFHWFQEKLIVIYPVTRLGASYFRFENANEKLVDLLRYFDTGITGYHMQAINENAFREYFNDPSLPERFLNKPERKDKPVKGVLRYGDTLFELQYGEKDTDISKLQFIHGKDESFYEYGQESDGTQRLVELLDVILNDDKEKVFLIDELDRSLHPQMTRKFVETFLNFSENMNTQLIITTHESNLMDLEILRRDEIWLAEKENDNTTTLYTLEKFKVRYDKVVAKDYLAGRYGAVPVFKDFEYVWGGRNNAEVESENP